MRHERREAAEKMGGGNERLLEGGRTAADRIPGGKLGGAEGGRSDGAEGDRSQDVKHEPGEGLDYPGERRRNGVAGLSVPRRFSADRKGRRVDPYESVEPHGIGRHELVQLDERRRRLRTRREKLGNLRLAQMSGQMHH